MLSLCLCLCSRAYASLVNLSIVMIRRNTWRVMEMLWLKAAHIYCWVNALIYSSTFVRQFTSLNKHNETIMFGRFIYSNNASLLSTLFKLMKASIQLSYCPRKIIEIVGMNFEGLKFLFTEAIQLNPLTLCTSGGAKIFRWRDYKVV